MKHTNDMTKGSPLKALVLFALPIILGNLFQQFYNLMDIAIVGNRLGDYSLAAVGATSALYGLFLSLAHGSANGFSIVIARYFGAGDREGLKRAIAHTLKLTVGLALLLTAVAIFATKPLLVLLKTPDVELSYRYISIVLFAVSVTVLYNVLSGILRAVGNSVAPLVFLIIGAVLNIGMDWLFVCVFDLGVFGAGLATVLAQVISCALTGTYLVIVCESILPKREHFAADAALSKDLFINALSMAMMFSIVSIGSVSLQFAVNSLGPDIVAAHTTARKIDETMMVMFAPLCTACATFCSQNYGAKRFDRIKQGILTSFALSFGISALAILLTFLFGNFLVAIVSGSDNPVVLTNGALYLRINLPFYFFLVTLVILRSTLQALGHKVAPLIASGVEMVGKLSIALFLVPRIGYMGIIVSEPAIWITCSVIVLADFLILLAALRKEPDAARQAESTVPKAGKARMVSAK